MPIYLLRCTGCGDEDELLVQDVVEHGAVVELPSQPCKCGCSTYRKVAIANTANANSLWAKQCRLGWLENKEAKQAIAGKGFDVD